MLSFSLKHYLKSTLGRKYIMALTGFVLVGFVMIHMLGNLLIHISPDAINAYAYKLHSIPDPLMLMIRLFLLASVLLHIWMAILLTIDNKKAKPAVTKSSVKSSYASRTMRMSGLILVSFIIFHILHYTIRVIPTMEYNNKNFFSDNISSKDYVTLYNKGIPVITNNKEIQTFNVYDMLIHGFKNIWVSFFYLLSVALLCLHLAHGISSLFQTLGFRNNKWKIILNRLAMVYGIIVFIGFASIPIRVLSGGLKYSYELNDASQQTTLQAIEKNL